MAITHLISVVIVTYNRIEKLKKCLEIFDNQTILPSVMVIVDNASTDGTKEYLEKWKEKTSEYKKIIVRSDINEGGSGGFYRGIKAALDFAPDWIWVSDDDAFPEVNALEIAHEFLCNKETSGLAGICGSVINKNQIELEHRKVISTRGFRIKEKQMPLSAYDNQFTDINVCSFVGSIFNKQIIETAGLPEKNYFIWGDDTEYSIRLSKYGKILCIPSIKIHHDVDESNSGLSWKDYYGNRNRLDLYRRHFPLIPYLFAKTRRYIKAKYLQLFATNKEYADLYYRAYIDGKNGTLGIHQLYRPGWKPKNNTRN